jgi:archaemetzincin
MSGTIQLVTVGNAPRGLLRELAQPIMTTFKIQSLSGAPLSHPQYALNPPRKQFHATAILRRLAVQQQPDQLGVVGVCDVDLFTPDADFVYGEADRESKTAIVSIFRLKGHEPPEIFVRRAQAEAVATVGQLLGLSACDEPHCAMFASRSPQDAERKGTALCNDCRHELLRLAGAKPIP